MDRIENALKPTSRKYLLQSVFGGKTCSQIVCTECGKVKNRIEDYCNISLTIQDLKSVYESFEKQVEGETISDYNCDGCGKKVDIKKRTLIAETPNVLILHLTRMAFNFETFRNEKVNTYFEFPNHLNLKEYSYYDVMRREDRLKTDVKADDDADSQYNETTAEETKATTTKEED